MRDILRWAERLSASYGGIDGLLVRRRVDEWRIAIVLTTAGGYRVPAFVEVDPKPPHLIRSAGVSSPCPSFRSPADVETAIAGLGEVTAVFGARITAEGLRPWMDIRGSRSLSVASAMKLYLLCGVTAEVADRRRAWNDLLALHDADRSMSSGIMHRWPTGTTLSLQACTALMVAESDNTAADMILHSVGRERAYRILGGLGHSNPAATTPYLSTAEMLKLKYQAGGALGERYLRLAREEREAFLDATVDPSEGEPGLSVKPRFVKEIGWFASARDLAEVLRHAWIQSDADPAAMPLAVLGLKAEEESPKLFFDYVGMKAGRDVGVRAWAGIVQRGQRWDVLTLIVNDTARDPADQDILSVVWGVLCGPDFHELPE